MNTLCVGLWHSTNSQYLRRLGIVVGALALASLVGSESLGASAYERYAVVSPHGMEDSDGQGLNYPVMHRGRMQMLYPSSDFLDVPSSLPYIDQVSFRLDGKTEFNGPISGPVSVYLSTIPEDGLSTYYEENHGTDRTRAYAGVVTWQSEDNHVGHPRAFDLDIQFSTPFPYDPADGNLLVDLVIDRSWESEETVLLDRHRSALNESNLTLVFGDQTSKVQGRSFDRSVIPAKFNFVDPVAGDADFDWEFTSVDLVRVFQSGQYEDEIPLNSRWDTGDWTGDLEFTSDDLVAAFMAGAYRLPPAISVPEPRTGLVCVSTAVMLLFTVARSQRRGSMAGEGQPAA